TVMEIMQNRKKNVAASIRSLAPVWIAWLAFIALKKLAGFSAGYVDFDPVRATYFLATGLTRCLYPNGTSAFFRSPVGLAVSALIMAAVTYFSVRDRRVRVAFALFLLTQLPYALMGAATSRYFYISEPPAFAVFILMSTHIPMRVLRTVFLIALLLSQ